MKSKLFKASTQNVFEVEITTVLGCSVDCIYCPQDVLSKSRSGRKPSLTVPDFLSAINNIDLPNVLLSWTGYSEATLHKNFPDFLKLAHQHRFGQVISTTLGGRQDSVLAAINFKNWASFSLHLPDDNGLMRGLDVTPHYLDLLDTAFSVRSEFLAPTKIICFGSNLHPEVKKYKIGSVFNPYTKKNLSKEINKITNNVGLLKLFKINASKYSIKKKSC